MTHPSSSVRHLFTLTLALLFSLLPGCAGSGGETVSSVGGTLVLEPGATGLCRAPPCRVDFRMPAGDGSYEVMSDTMSIGTYPAGQTVTLGSFYRGHTFKVKGVDVPPAYFYIGR